MAINLRTLARLEALSLVELRQAQHALREFQAHLAKINTELQRTLQELQAHKDHLLQATREGLTPPQLQLLENHFQHLDEQLQTFKHQQELAIRRRDQHDEEVQQKLRQLRQHERCREHLEKLQQRQHQHREDRHMDELAIRPFAIPDLD